MRFVGRGHPAIRATHDKTLELTPADSLTERGTCVIAVGTSVDPAAPMAGPVRIRITVGSHRFSLDAIANPQWEPSHGAVIRRSRWRRPDTFATEASATAADLPRDLVAALADADQLVSVDVAARPAEQSVLVLFAATGPSPALGAELAAADVVFALDDGARALIGRHDARSPVLRTLVVATESLPRRGPREAERVEVLGLPPELAAAAAHPGDAVLLLGGADPTVFVARGDGVGAYLPATVAPLGGPIQTDDHDLPAAHPVGVCRATDLDPRVRAAVDGLLAAGAPTRAAADALAALTGQGRRAAYDTVLTWRR